MENEKQIGLELDYLVTELELRLTEVIGEFERISGRAVERLWLQRRGETIEGRYIPSAMNQRNRFVLRTVGVTLDDRGMVSTEWAMGAKDDRGDEIQD